MKFAIIVQIDILDQKRILATEFSAGTTDDDMTFTTQLYLDRNGVFASYNSIFGEYTEYRVVMFETLKSAEIHLKWNIDGNTYLYRNQDNDGFDVKYKAILLEDVDSMIDKVLLK